MCNMEYVDCFLQSFTSVNLFASEILYTHKKKSMIQTDIIDIVPIYKLWRLKSISNCGVLTKSFSDT